VDQLPFDAKADAKVRLEATRLIADRGRGKVPAYMPVEADDALELTRREIDAAADDFRAEVIRIAEAEAVRRGGVRGVEVD
jgi:hypothetical protein